MALDLSADLLRECESIGHRVANELLESALLRGSSGQGNSEQITAALA